LKRSALVFLLGLVAWTATTAVASAAVWTETTPQFFFPGFVGVGASSSTDVWAVGENDADFETPVAEHWDGSRWQGGVLGVLRPNDGGLFGVSALSATNAWAVGWQDTPGTGALALHWNGTSWTVKPTPAPTSGTRSLSSVSAISPSNVWAVGGQGVTNTRPLVEHWNGAAWKVVSAPGSGALTSVKAVSATNVWAVGADLVEHYNGTGWTMASAPITSMTNLTQINRISGTTHLWAVGTDTATGTPVAISFNGSAWSAHNPPGVGQLGGVAALAAGDVWASGSTPNGNSTTNFTVHWNGSTWSRVAPAGLANGWVENMTRAPGSTQLWAVGMDLGTDGPFAAYRR
jgi:hypothetical protein